MVLNCALLLPLASLAPSGSRDLKSLSEVVLARYPSPSKRTQCGLCHFACALGKISACVGEPRVQTLLYEAHFHLFRSRRIWVSTSSLSALRTLLIVNVFGLSGPFCHKSSR